MSALDFNDILHARTHLQGIVRETPFEKSDILSDQTNEAEIRSAIRFLLEHHRLVMEGSGAVGVAALLHDRWSEPGRKAGVVLSGGNLDYQLLKKIIADQAW